MRIVSLLASGTEIECARGAGKPLLGRSHEGVNPPWVRGLPRCSEPAFDISVPSRQIDAEVNRRIRSGEPLYRIDTELIRSLAPDLIIAQEHCEVCAVTPGDVERSQCNVPGAPILSLTASSVEEVAASILQVAQALGIEAEGRRVVEAERDSLEKVRRATADRHRPPVV